MLKKMEIFRQRSLSFFMSGRASTPGLQRKSYYCLRFFCWDAIVTFQQMNSRKALRYYLAYVLLHGVLHSIAEQDAHIIR